MKQGVILMISFNNFSLACYDASDIDVSEIAVMEYDYRTQVSDVFVRIGTKWDCT